MSPGIGFLVAFGLTLVSLALVVVTGFAARRKLHIPLVAITFAGLGVTVYYAYGLGKIYDLHAAGWITPLHLTLARVTTACFLLPIATGIRTLFVPSTRRLHRKFALLVVALTVVTAVTGGIMLWLAPERA